MLSCTSARDVLAQQVHVVTSSSARNDIDLPNVHSISTPARDDLGSGARLHQMVDLTIWYKLMVGWILRESRELQEVQVSGLVVL